MISGVVVTFLVIKFTSWLWNIPPKMLLLIMSILVVHVGCLIVFALSAYVQQVEWSVT